ncbi:MAG: iron-containing redox enzyme family protein [Pseudomonadota bacterium]
MCESFSAGLRVWDLHAALNHLNQRRLAPAAPDAHWQADLRQTHELALLEGDFLAQSQAEVAEQAACAPTDPDAFLDWFNALREHGPGQHDPLFDHLADHATLDEVRWFLRQELAGEAGFEDLVALSQLRLPERAKLELARNYWDEMGQGKPHAMHGPMLGILARELDIQDTPLHEITWESIALGNLLVGLAYNRRYAYHALGALGVVELTAPSRAVKVVQALDRLGVARRVSRYFRVHAVVDVGHARTWGDEVLRPLVAERPEVAVWLAQGALMRLQAGARTFERYRRELGVHAPLAQAA